MKYKEINEAVFSGNPVYAVIGFNFNFYAVSIIVDCIETDFETVPVATFVNPFTLRKEEVSANEIYLDYESAQKAAMEMQKNHGHVIITQDQYDEYMDLKKNFGNNS